MKLILLFIFFVSFVSCYRQTNQIYKDEKIYTVEYLCDILSLENNDFIHLPKTRIIFLILNIFYSDQDIREYTSNLDYKNEFKRCISTIESLVCNNVITLDKFDESFEMLNYKPFTRDYINDVIIYFCSF